MLRTVYANSLDVIEAHPIPVLLSRGNIREPIGDRGTISSDVGMIRSTIKAYGILWRILYEAVDVISVYSHI
ncbi:hypothetical protein B6V01_005045 [Methanosarcinales archaeon ex4572_44]|nr:MAG: hypothetical protein B6V01_005045 [Methanosarcinales archaeon ex4572_44]